MDSEEIVKEVSGYLTDVKSDKWRETLIDGEEHIYSKYEYIAGVMTRLSELHINIAWQEAQGLADAKLKKVRTMVVDDAMEQFKELARFESRKISAIGEEYKMSNSLR